MKKTEIRQFVLNKFGCKCAYCGQPIDLKSLQVDHVVSRYNFIDSILDKSVMPIFLQHLTLNDVNHIDNLFPACRYCNKHKDTFTIEGFRKEISMQVERANLYSANYRAAKRFGLIAETPKPIVFYFENFNNK